jgi:hypothetical protein
MLSTFNNRVLDRYGVNEFSSTLHCNPLEDKMRRFKGECAHFCFKKCPIYTHYGASVKFTQTQRITM